MNDILVNAFKMVWFARRDFIAMAALPVVGLALIASAFDFISPGGMAQLDENGMPVSFNGSYFINMFLSLIFYVMFAVAWHRRCLLRETSVTVGTALKWDTAKSIFLFRLIGLGLLTFLALLPIAVLFAFLLAMGINSGPIMFMVMTACAMIIFSRLAICLPATAIGDKISIRQSWKITEGNSWRMLLIALVPSIPVMLAQVLIMSIVVGLLEGLNSAETLTGSFAVSLIGQSISYVGIAIGVAALSGAYKYFKSQAA